MSQYVGWALVLGFLYLLVRAYTLGRQVRELSERVDDVARRARDFDRRYEQDVERSREAVKLEIQSALHVLRKQQEQGSAPADPQRDRIVNTLRTVFDPEIPVNVYDLGLIYDIATPSEKQVHIKMSLTSEACPSAKEIPADIERKLRSKLSLDEVKVDIVWEPKWGPHMISDEGKQKLGLVPMQ